MIGVGSGGHYAQGTQNILGYNFILIKQYVAAALALIDIDSMEAEAVARKAMRIAGDMCVYTNHNLTVEILDPSLKKEGVAKEEETEKSA